MVKKYFKDKKPFLFSFFFIYCISYNTKYSKVDGLRRHMVKNSYSSCSSTQNLTHKHKCIIVFTSDNKELGSYQLL